ncbi:HET-domain-containing protein [Dendrothele bispora CBS 962.96]|uniref:HET-domain-containing protein n=1 Tax=Dendrothele bispora (strain CBS 962.96) TaxID=1314807 RepID=A0A4V4HD86_DENBC|nr:HET-domain-containing protein [Dendrothele bispora CBS 962.96]
MCSATSTIRSLVCDDCWTGPFSQQSFRTLGDGDKVVYKTTWSKVREAAARGCGLCSLLIVDDENHEDDVSFHLGLSSIPQTSGFQVTGPPHTQILGVEIEGDELEMENTYFLYTGLDDPAAKEIVAKEPLRDVQSEQSFSMAFKCLDDCIKRHPACPKPDQNAHLPTRVIDCSDPFHPKLVISQGALNVPYVALSYVWGGPQPNCTTAKNLETYIRVGIDIESVPKTIQDAIQVTNKFGFRYLWVDAFCIIQDSAEDKKKELIQMRQIFRDAYFTIVASRAETAFAGFLYTCTSPQNPSPRLPFWCKDGHLGTVSTQPMFIPYDATSEPADQRAWCYEERLLSARKLVYASDTLYYHCQSAATAVGGSISLPRTSERLLDVMLLPDDKIGAHVAEWKYLDWRELRHKWADIIANYTARGVTKPKDKLTALAGVAEEREDIPNPRPSQYLAPSWSWASVQGRITLMPGMLSCYELFGDPSEIKSCEILSCDVVVEDERLSYGRVRSGVLKLHSKMVPVSWTGGSYDSEFGLFTSEKNVQDVTLLKVRAEAEGDSSLRCVGDVSIDSIKELDEGPLWLVFIIWNVSVKTPGAGGLIITDNGDGKFKRVGFWQIPDLEIEAEDDRKAMLSWYTTIGNESFDVLEIV